MADPQPHLKCVCTGLSLIHPALPMNYKNYPGKRAHSLVLRRRKIKAESLTCWFAQKGKIAIINTVFTSHCPLCSRKEP